MARKLVTRREIIKRRRRERQVLVFGSILLALAGVGVISAAAYQGTISLPFLQQAIVTPSPDLESTVKVPCPPSGEEALPMPANQVSVRVLNGTDKQGLAGSTLEVLVGRGYVSAGATNWNQVYDESIRIQFGEAGLRQAYTVAGNFTDVEFVLDNRDSAVVDIILGAKFEVLDMRGAGAPELSPTTELSAPGGKCLPINLVQPKPAPAIIPVDPLATASASPSPSATP